MNRVGIVVALASEARALTSRRLPPGDAVTLGDGVEAELCGMGPVAAAVAAQRLIERGARALLVFGVAGGLDEKRLAGDLICPDTILDETGRRYACDPSWRACEAAGQGDILLSVNAALTDPRAKAVARARFGAHAVDMESAAVAAVAKARGAALRVIRAIADDAHTGLPPGIIESADAYGRPRPRALLGSLLRNPAGVRALPGLAMRMNRALSALRALAEESGPRFGWAA